MRTSPQREGAAPTTSASLSPTPNADLKRRRFLLALGAGPAAGAAAAAQAIAAPVASDAAVPQDASTSGYRETEHVRDYYKSARI